MTVNENPMFFADGADRHAASGNVIVLASRLARPCANPDLPPVDDIPASASAPKRIHPLETVGMGLLAAWRVADLAGVPRKHPRRGWLHRQIVKDLDAFCRANAEPYFIAGHDEYRDDEFLVWERATADRWLAAGGSAMIHAYLARPPRKRRSAKIIQFAARAR